MAPSSLKNLGPATDQMLAAVGIETADEVRDLGAPFVYRLLKHRFGTRINRIALWALTGAIEDRHWNSFSDEEKVALDEAVSGETDLPSPG